MKEKHLRKITMTLVNLFENGDPASPIGAAAVIERDGKEVVTIEFPDEDNEDIQNVICDAIEEHFGIKVQHTFNADSDYGYQ